MRAAMADAEVGDDVYGEDPTVNALEAEVAELLGHEAGLFVPSGSLGNQLGLRLLAKPGEEIVCDVTGPHRPRRTRRGGGILRHHVPHLAERARRARRRRGARADRAGRRAVPGLDGGDRGREHAQLRRRHGAAGRRSSPPSSSWPAPTGLALHLDGARLWNAHVATGTSLAELAAAVRHRVGVPVQGSGRAGRVGARVERRPHRRGAGVAQALRRRHAAGRHPRRRRTVRARPPHRAARRRPRPGRAAGRGAGRRRRRRRPTSWCCTPTTRRGRGARPARRACWSRRSARSFLRLVTHLDVDDDGIDRAIDVLGRSLHD